MITHVPAPTKETTFDPSILHTALAEASTVKTGVNPDDAVPVTRYVAPPTSADDGAEDVNVTSCVGFGVAETLVDADPIAVAETYART